jgi:two-component system, OmpR family, sensor histidine kinase TctE
VLLQVCDDGPGINENERSRVLERFYRVQGTSGEGTGLGLAIASEIAHLHGTQLVLQDHHTDAATPAHSKGLKVSVWFTSVVNDALPRFQTPAFTRGIRAQ